MKYLEKFIPAEDKLKHFYLGLFAFAFISIFIDDLSSVCIVFLLAWGGELYQRANGGKNGYKEMFKDVFFGVSPGLLITISNSF